MTMLFAVDFNAPTALGIPLGLLLLIWVVWMMSQQQGRAGGSGVAPSTMDVNIRGEVAPTVIQFQNSEQQNSGGKCVIRYTVKFKEKGTFVVAGGCVVGGSFSPGYYGTRTVTGDIGDVISGAVSCPTFFSGIWGIGAFRSSHDIPVG